MRIGFGSDYLGFECKGHLKAKFARQGHTTEDFSVEDLGTEYRTVTDQLASGIYKNRVERGVLVCSRAIGASVRANKQPGVRAALCHDAISARRSVEDDGMNVLVIAASVVTDDLAWELAATFIGACYVPREHLFGIPPRRLARVIEHIRNNLDQPLSVNVLSRVADMSQSHFSKLFQAEHRAGAASVRSAVTH